MPALHTAGHFSKKLKHPLPAWTLLSHMSACQQLVIFKGKNLCQHLCSISLCQLAPPRHGCLWLCGAKCGALAPNWWQLAILLVTAFEL